MKEMPEFMSNSAENIPSTFENLLKISLRRKYHPLIFGKLIKEFVHKLSNTTQDIDLTPLFLNSNESALQREYIYEVLIKSDLNNTFDNLIGFFTTYITKLSYDDQTSLLVYFNQIHNKLPFKELVENTPLLNALSSYLKYLITNNSQQHRRLVLMVTKFIVNIFDAGMSKKIDESFLEHVGLYLDWLQSHSCFGEYTLLNGKFKEHNLSYVKLGYENNVTHRDHENNNGISGVPVRREDKDNGKLLRMKKLIWLSQKITVEFATIDDDFIMEFRNLLNLSKVPSVETGFVFTYEIITGLFDCLELSTQITDKIWKQFIIGKLPWLLKILKINQAKLESSLTNVLKSDIVDWGKYEDLIVELEKNLLELELIKPGQIKLFDDENLNTFTIPMTLDSLNHSYTAKFLETNPEFVTIEEAGINEFLSQVNTSLQLKHRLSQLVIESISSFIMTNDTLRLRRLLVSLTLQPTLFDYILLVSSPYSFISPLLKFLENNAKETPEPVGLNSNDKLINQSNEPDLLMELDLGGDDSSNAQDFFTDISIVLVFVQYVIFRYSLSLSNSLLPSIPNALAIIKNTSITSSTNDPKEINEVTLNDETMNKWISSLFDSNNTEGISDSLIKLSTPMKYSKLVPRIVYEAILARQVGWLDDEAMIGGLEYLHQGFLIGWLVGVIKNVCRMSWSTDVESNILEKAMKKLLGGENEESLELKVVTGLIRKIVNDDVWYAFDGLKSELKKPLMKTKVRKDIEKLIRWLGLGEEKCRFELIHIWQTVEISGLDIDWFYQEMCFLINTSDSVVEFSFEFISRLIVTYAKWKIGEDSVKKWLDGLNLIKEENSNDETQGLIFNRKAKELIFDNVTEEKKEVKKEEDGFDSNFFGFIQEPKMEDIDDNIDLDVKIEEKGMDLLGLNLFLLVEEKEEPRVVDGLVRKILNNLN